MPRFGGVFTIEAWNEREASPHHPAVICWSRWRSDEENYLGTQEGDATFSLEVTGTSGNGVVSVRMQKHLGIWKVMSAELHEANDRTIALDKSGD